VIDLHCHILPGLDDGPGTLEESLDLARALVAAGIMKVAATPHVRHDYPTTPAQMERGLAAVRSELARHAVPLELLPGGEIALDLLERLEVRELRRFGLGGNAGCLLLEFPYTSWPFGIAPSVSRLTQAGITPIIAHPERNPAVQADPAKLEAVVTAGALIQVTAGSITGAFGRRTRRTSIRLTELGLAHMIASDAHRSGARLAAVSVLRQAVSDARLADWLTIGVPSAIVSGVALPPRPEPPPRRLYRLLRRL
jgi:protein-tyrosine phosphatase